MPTYEYLDSLMKQVKKYVPAWLYKDLHRVARASAGGRIRHKQPADISIFEKLSIPEIRLEKLKEIDDRELKTVWLRLNQLHSNAVRQKRAVENIVNAAVRTIEEMRRRNIKVDESLPLVQAVVEFGISKEGDAIQVKLLSNINDEVVVKDSVDDENIKKLAAHSSCVADTKDKIERSFEIPISKIDEEKQIASFIVSDPYQIDAQGDWISPAEVEKYAYVWMEKSRKIGLKHKKLTSAVVVGSTLVPYPSMADYKAAMKNELHDIYNMKYGNDRANSGSHIVDIKFPDDLWKGIKDGIYKAVSIGGFGIRRSVPKAAMPKVGKIIEVG